MSRAPAFVTLRPSSRQSRAFTASMSTVTTWSGVTFGPGMATSDVRARDGPGEGAAVVR